MMDFKKFPLKKVKKYSIELSLTIIIILIHFIGFRLEDSWMKLITLLGVVYISYSFSKASALLSVLLFLVLFGVHEGMHHEENEPMQQNDKGGNAENKEEDLENISHTTDCDDEDEDCKQRLSQLDIQENFRNMR